MIDPKTRQPCLNHKTLREPTLVVFPGTLEIIGGDVPLSKNAPGKLRWRWRCVVCDLLSFTEFGRPAPTPRRAPNPEEPTP